MQKDSLLFLLGVWDSIDLHHGYTWHFFVLFFFSFFIKTCYIQPNPSNLQNIQIEQNNLTQYIHNEINYCKGIYHLLMQLWRLTRIFEINNTYYTQKKFMTETHLISRDSTFKIFKCPILDKYFIWVHVNQKLWKRDLVLFVWVYNYKPIHLANINKNIQTNYRDSNLGTCATWQQFHTSPKACATVKE